MLVIRQTTFSKQDSVYLSFGPNALYVVCNLIGEMMMKNAARGVPPEDTEQSLLGDNWRWISNRIVESYLMSILGGSQEEGALAVLRKIYLALYMYARGAEPFVLNLGKLADKLNECLIDRPLATYFANSIKCIIDRMRILQLGVETGEASSSRS